MVDLNHIGVIVTRPKGQSESLIQRIEAHHGTPFEVPCLQIAEVADKRKARNRINQAKQFDYLLFTSPNSVSHAIKLGLKLEGDFQLIAIGTGTRNALLEHCDRPIIQAPKPYTSEALIEKLGDISLKDQRILIISGEGGRRILGDSLRDDYGAKTEYLDVYRREVPKQFPLEGAKEHLDAGAPLVLLISSQEALNNLHPSLVESGLNERIQCLIVGSDRLKEHAQSLGYQSIVVAASALEDDLWEALIQESKTLQESMESSASKVDSDPADSITLGHRGDALIDNPATPDQEKEDSQAQEAIEFMSHDNDSDSNTQPLNDEKSEEIVDKNREQTMATQHEADSPNVIIKKSGSAISWLALLAAIGAAGYSYYLDLQSKNDATQSDPAPFVAMDQRLNQLETAQSTLNKQVQSMPQSLPALPISSAEIADLKEQMKKLQAVEQLGQSVTELNQEYQSRIASLESSNATLQEALEKNADHLNGLRKLIDEQNNRVQDSSDLAQRADDLASSFEARLAEELDKQRAIVKEADRLVASLKNSTDVEALRLTEIEYLLNFAAYKLSFEVDLPVVAYALREAKNRLESVTSLNLSETLKRLEPALAQIETLLENPIEIEKYAEALITAQSLVTKARLAEELTAVEFREALHADQQARDRAAKADENRRWYQKLGDTLSPLFIVQKRRIDDPLFIANADAKMIQQNILLQLNTARLAILQGQGESYRDSVAQARRWIDQYYDHTDDYTNDAIALLDELLSVKTAYSAEDLPNLDPIRSIYRATRNVNREGGL